MAELRAEQIEHLKQLIAYTLEPRINECRVMGGKLVFRGTAQLHLVCLNREGKVESADLELSISQYAELGEDPGADAQGDIRMGVTSLELEKDDEDHLHLLPRPDPEQHNEQCQNSSDRSH